MWVFAGCVCVLENYLVPSVLFVRVLCANAVRVGVCGGCVCLGALNKNYLVPVLRFVQPLFGPLSLFGKAALSAAPSHITHTAPRRRNHNHTTSPQAPSPAYSEAEPRPKGLPSL